MSIRKDNYEQYIKLSPVWKAKRQERLKLDGHACKKCKSDGGDKPLHVHHRTYDRFGGRERITDLVTLCEKCHADVHKLHRKKHHLSLEKITGKFLSETVTKGKSPRQPARKQTMSPRKKTLTPGWSRDSDSTWIKTSSRTPPDEIRKRVNGI
jgi:hypothetical protein